MSNLELLGERKKQLEQQIAKAKKDNREGLVRTYEVSLQHVKDMESTMRMIDRILEKHQAKDYLKRVEGI